MKTEGKSIQISFGRVIGCWAMALIILSQFRLASLAILVLLASFLIFWRRCRRKPFVHAAAILLLVTSFLPFDVALGSIHVGSRRGDSPGGPHFVRFVVGKPMHTKLISKYGEYISAGCTWPAMNPPKWVLVWN